MNGETDAVSGRPGRSQSELVGRDADATTISIADDQRAEQARKALKSASGTQAWAIRFGLLGDENRLKILLALHRAPGITVGDLAAAVGMSDNAASHALSALRMAGVVAADRDGRYRRWSIADHQIHDILHAVGASHSLLHPHH